MLAFLFQRQRKGKQVGLTRSCKRKDICHFRLTAGDGAGLIQCDDLRFARLFQRCRGLEQDTTAGAFAIANHDGHRRGQPERTRAADDQHRDASGQRISDILAQKQPDDNGHDRDRDDDRDKHTGYAIGDLSDRRFGRRRITDHLNDLRQCRILSYTSGLTAQETRLIQSGRRYRIILCFIHWNAFAGQRSFIYRAVPFHDDAIDRNVLPRPDHKDITFSDFIDRDLNFLAISDQGSGLWRKLHQALQRVGRPALRIRFQCLSDGDQRQDRRG